MVINTVLPCAGGSEAQRVVRSEAHTLKFRASRSAAEHAVRVTHSEAGQRVIVGGPHSPVSDLSPSGGRAAGIFFLRHQWLGPSPQRCKRCMAPCGKDPARVAQKRLSGGHFLHQGRIA